MEAALHAGRTGISTFRATKRKRREFSCTFSTEEHFGGFRSAGLWVKMRPSSSHVPYHTEDALSLSRGCRMNRANSVGRHTSVIPEVLGLKPKGVVTKLVGFQA